MSMNDAVLDGSQTLAAPPMARESPTQLVSWFAEVMRWFFT